MQSVSAQNLHSNPAITQTQNTNFVDEKPGYRQWQPAYTITKVAYQGDEMTITFQYKGYYTYITLWENSADQAWVLRDDKGNLHRARRIGNVARNGVVFEQDITKKTVSFNVEETDFITAEITFQRPAKDVQKVDLLEGANYLDYSNHFHVFDIPVFQTKEVSDLAEKPVKPYVEPDYVMYETLEPQEMLPVEVEELEDTDEILGGMGYREVEELETAVEIENYDEYIETPYVPGIAPAYELSDMVAAVKKPAYKSHNKDYTVDRIEYRENEMVITFTFHDDTYPSGTFYGPQGEHAWFLRDKAGNKYPSIAVNNLRMNGTTIAEGILTDVVTGEMVEVDYSEDAKKNNFTCDIVFPRLPQGVKLVDLIEGEGRESYSYHFNAFNIKIKQFRTQAEPVVEPAVEEPATEPVVAENREEKRDARPGADEVAVSKNYTLFPNPNTGAFFLTNAGANQDKATVQVLDLSGKVVFTQQTPLLQNATQGFKVDNLVAGQYLVRIQHADNTVETLKMIVVE